MPQEKKCIENVNTLQRHHKIRRKHKLIAKPTAIIRNKVPIYNRPKIKDELGRTGDFEINLEQCRNMNLVTIYDQKTQCYFTEK